MRRAILTVTWAILSLVLGAGYGISADAFFVGSEACKDCHQEQYENFMNYSKKAKSFESIKKMEKKLSPEEYQSCFECHTTGYGHSSGFVSEEKTPELKNPGCEVCHGPGGDHVESEDPDDIKRQMTMENCTSCHNKERVADFNFKPLLYGGAH